MLPPDRVGTVTVPISQTDGSKSAGREEKEEICVQPSSEKLSAVGLFAVSYTHLDVYKRQV